MILKTLSYAKQLDHYAEDTLNYAKELGEVNDNIEELDNTVHVLGVVVKHFGSSAMTKRYSTKLNARIRFKIGFWNWF